MVEHFDRLETRSPHSREAHAFRDLRAILGVAKARAPSLRQQLKGVVIADIKSRADLGRIRILRNDDLQALQFEHRPFGGLVAMRSVGLKRWLALDESLDAPEGRARDWWGAARAMVAAGVTSRSVILNCFPYPCASLAFMMESGAETIGAAIIPAGCDDVDRILNIAERMRPTFYCGSPEFLRRIVDKAEIGRRKIRSIARALVAGGTLTQVARDHLAEHGIVARRIFANDQLGIIAYETEGPDGGLTDGMVVSEHLLVEIIKPGTDLSANVGETGEVVVTRVTADYPLLRFATGDLSAVVPGPSPCGRTNMRITAPLGADCGFADIKAAVSVVAAAATGLGAHKKKLDPKP